MSPPYRKHGGTQNLDEFFWALAQALDTSGIATFLLDDEFSVVWVNHAVEEYFDLNREDLLDRSKKALIRSEIYEILEQPDRFEKKLLATYENNEYVESFECHITPGPEREERWLLHWSSPIESGPYAGGRIEQYMDITDRKQTQKELADRKTHLDQAQSIANLGSWYLNLEDNELHWSDEVYRIFGIPSGQSITYERFLNCVHPEDRAYVDDRWTAAIEGGESYDIEHRIIVDGSVRWVHEKAELQFDHQERPVSGIGVVQDITESKRREKRVRDLAEILRTLRRVNHRLVRGKDVEETLVDVAEILADHPSFNCVFLALTGEEKVRFTCGANTPLTQDQVNDFHTEEYIRTVAREGLLGMDDVTCPPFQQHFGDEDSHRGLAFELRQEEQTYGVLTLHYAPGASSTEEERGMLKELAGDIAFTIRAHEDRRELERRSVTDSVTGLYNRTYFLETLQERLDSMTSGQTDPISLIHIDLRRFKRINDSLGYPAGDFILSTCADRIRAEMPENYTVARLSGDEFQVLVPDPLSRGQILDRARRILNRLSKPVTVEGTSVRIGARVGIARAQDGARTAQELMARAHEAIEDAGYEPEEQIQFYADRTRDQFSWTLELEEDFRSALDQQSLELHYQPQVSLKSGEIRGVEALLRWNHPEQGFISPVELIETAQKIGRMSELGSWILGAACSQAYRWNQNQESPVRVAVNVAPTEFLQGGYYIDTVDAILEETRLKPGQLELEVTERQAIDDLDYTADILHELADRSVTIALDDFGTGYSALSYLSRLPVDLVKIDRSFIQKMPSDPTYRKVVTSLIDVVNDLGICTLAEGVEESSQMRMLRDANCDYYQGYYYSRPLPPREIDPGSF